MTDCKAYRSEIEESAGELSDLALAHVESCPACGEVLRVRESLRRLVGGLERIEAPADFEFRLRARIAARRGTRGGRPFAGRRNLYGFGAVAGMRGAAEGATTRRVPGCGGLRAGVCGAARGAGGADALCARATTAHKRSAQAATTAPRLFIKNIFRLKLRNLIE